MPNATRIVRRRRIRQRRHQQGNRRIGRSSGIIFLVLLVIGVGLAGVGLVGATAVYATLTRDLPDFPDIEQRIQSADPSPTTQIYAWNNQTDREPVLIHEISDPLAEERQWITLDQLPQHLIDATVAGTDPNFWQNREQQLLVAGRAFYAFMQQGGTAVNAPSITRQVIQHNLLTPRTLPIDGNLTAADYLHQLETLLLTHRAANIYSREQILEWYLNTSFYGNLAFGIDAAAHVYFNKAAADLTLAEAAMLAAVPQAPDANPINDLETAQGRQAMVLDRMAAAAMVSAETAVTAQQIPLTISPGIEERFDIIAPHFALYVQKELARRLGPELVLGGGLRVYTSLDLTMQQQAECVARAQLNRLSGTIGPALPADELAGCAALDFLPPLNAAVEGIDHNINNTAVLMLDPRTAEIKAMVGSLNYWDEQIDGAANMAVDGLRQPGTILAPFTYLTALSQGFTAAGMVLDVETDFGTDAASFIPQNENGRFQGPLRLRQALAGGANSPAVQVMSWVGVNQVIRTAHNMGITTLVPGEHGLTLALDGGEISLLDLVYAYAVMDNMGVMVGQPRPTLAPQADQRTLDPVAILRVEDNQGNVLYAYDQPQQREILTPQLAFLMNDMLSDRQARCVGIGCPNVLELPQNRPAAVKTGQTSDHRDVWTVGYTPTLVTGVWLGNANDQPTVPISGLDSTAPIWHALTSWALQNEPVLTWERPSGITEISVCTLSGLLPTPICPTVSELFIAGTEPTVPDSMVQEFAVNRETGRLATIYTPPELVETEVYVIYPEAAAEWAAANGIPQPPIEYDSIVVQSGSGNEASITSPANFDIVREQIIITGTAQSSNFDFYRLAYFQGLQPNNIQTIADQQTRPKENGTLGTWDISELNGLYTLLLTVVREDGSFAETTTHITIDNTPPQVRLISPQSGRQPAPDDASLLVQAQASDDVGIAHVAFYVDQADNPFAVLTDTPFIEQWPIQGSGCRDFYAVAVDKAGNEGESTAVTTCLDTN